MTRGHRFALLIVGLLLLITSSPTNAQQQDTIDTRNVNRLAAFVDMEYPLAAKRARLQGVVVVRVSFDEQGRVASAIGVSGVKLLVDACLENVKRWTFKADSGRNAVIVYDFSIDGACHDDSHSLFRLRHWNSASITVCDPVIVG
jgi:TonB family protein